MALVVFLSAPVFAQMPPPPPPRMIAVSGEAKEEVAPDQAILSLSVVSRGAKLDVAKQDNDARVEKLVAVAREFKISKEKLATSHVNISPEYSYDNNKRKFLGYVVNRSFRVTMDELSIHERVLSAMVDTGVSDEVGGVQFTVADPEARLSALRVKAFENAKAKAEALAKAAGAKLGPAISIEAGGQYSPPPRPMMMMARGAAMEKDSSVAPSLPGMETLRETVNVTFAME